MRTISTRTSARNPLGSRWRSRVKTTVVGAAIVVGLVGASVSQAAPEPPRFSSMTPTSGPAGTVVTVTGQNFEGLAWVRFHGRLAASFTLQSSTRFQAVVPTGATSGKISFATPVSTRWGSAFTVTSSSAPPPPPPPPPPPNPPPPPPPSSGSSVIRVDQPFVCNGPVNLDLVRITMRNRDADAITIGSGCTGRIGRVEVETWKQDGIKVQNQPNPAHDLVIGGGYVKGWALSPGAHQDGIQVMGGSRITFRNLFVDVVGAQNLFINKAGSGASTPTNIVCENCMLGPNVSTPLLVNVSNVSGARNTVVCTAGRYGRSISYSGASAPAVNAGNTVLPVGDSRCRNITGR
jgi:IPT/TIG domain-containing protein